MCMRNHITMEHRTQHASILIVIFLGLFYHSHGCQIDSFNPPTPTIFTILDTFRGTIFDLGASSDVLDITYTFGESLNKGPYVNVTFENSRFVVKTNNNYDDYEENETALSIPLNVNLICTGNVVVFAMVIIQVTDTNNNAPRFHNDLVYTISAPVPPGYEVLGCNEELVVRDIDLTTQRVNFEITDNPNFEIIYDASSSTTPKEFKAKIRTTTFIRNIREPITFTIAATDVDLTGDPPITTRATVTILGNPEFEVPDEPAFNQTYYLGQYTTAHEIVMAEPISLLNGYDEFVNFTLEGEFSNNFELVENQNVVALRVLTPLILNDITAKQLLLTVRATRENTSGATATVILQLPEDLPLEFERAHYLGTIEDNNLRVPPLVLQQGYEGLPVSANILNEYASYFSATVQGNTITLSMTSLNENIINENNYIHLQIVASTARSRATTIVSLEIIKDDNITPVFNRPIYEGSYNPDTGLTLEQIIFIQGYDDTVSLSLEGDNADYFQIQRDGPVISLNALSIPPEIFTQQRIVLSLKANKPRTVGAHAAIIIALPASNLNVQNIAFDRVTYQGTITNNVTNLEPITVVDGYSDDITFRLDGGLSSYFGLTRQREVINVILQTPIPSALIPANRIIALEIRASAPQASTAHATIVFQVVIENDATSATQLVFDAPYYTGSYNASAGLVVDSSISLSQGYDDSVQFTLEGENARWFNIDREQDVVWLTLTSTIPGAVLTNNRQLVFVIVAQRPGYTTAKATIVISLTDENTKTSNLGFDRVTYQGTILNNITNIEPITLIEGYTDDVTFSLYGALSSYFDMRRQGAKILVALQTPIPSALIPANRIIVLEIRASAPQAGTAHASIVFQVVVEDDDSSEPLLMFDALYYTGTYNANDGLVFEKPITLSQGYDGSVQFALEGDNAQWFGLAREQNSITLIQTSAIPSAVLTNNRQLIFGITASRTESITGRATIVISLTDDNIDISNIGFSRVTYLGIIQNNATEISTPITLSEGYTDDVIFGLYGELSSYFRPTRQGAVVNIVLQTPIPTQNIPTNRIIVLEIRASTPQGGTAYATVVFEVVIEDGAPSVIQLIFDAPYYTGSYNTSAGLVVDSPISLSQGYDDSVQFTLEGDHARWFSIEREQNIVSLTLTSAIPGAVLTNNRQLVFVIVAQRPGYATAKATIVISLTDDNTKTSNLGFDRVTYQGTILNNITNIVPITLIEGYTDDVTFSLYGVLSSYFDLRRQGAEILIALQTPIPSALIPANRIIVLEIRASAPQAGTAHATIVFQVVVEDDDSSEPLLMFDAPYYTGTYNANDGLIFKKPITLSQGYDGNVQFALEGDNAQWFGLTREQNSITLIQTSAIPSAVLTNNRQLIFGITATRTGSVTGRATIVISLTDDNIEISNIGFSRVTYLGIIQNNATEISTPITLSEGYTDDVSFGLYGELSSYFKPIRQGAVVNIVLQTPIPTQNIPANRIIVLEVRASTPQGGTAYATVVFEVVIEDGAPSVIQLVFDAPYYTGSYNASAGLVVDSPISLSQGYDDSVQFTLEGDHARWFSIEREQNIVSLTVTSAIPGAVLTNNRQLVFVIVAQRPGYATAKATIVISLTDDNTKTPNLGFGRVTYQGTILNNITNIEPITLIEGYTDDVSFSLYGVLSSYFDLRRQGAEILIALQTPIPSALIPANRIIVLEIRASAPQAGTAHATIVFQVVVEDDDSSEPLLMFDAPYYTGTYNANDGLIFKKPITLSQGYDGNIQFALEGDNAQWFGLAREQNSITLIQTSAIPSAVLTNNRQLIFGITATRTGSVTGRATIVISLTDNNIEISNIGFSRVTYLGIIQNNATEISTPITLSEGYTDDVSFGLYGELSSYFRPVRQGAVVNIVLQSPIPTQNIPANRIIVLEIRASTPQGGTAYATVVFEVVIEDGAPSVIQLVFDAPYYTGSYNASAGLVVDSPISLSQGYDDSVQFTLEGDNARWFSIERDRNIVVLTLTSAIPGAVLTNNRQLVFVIVAQRSGYVTAKATIIISLTDDNTKTSNLGFDRVTYQGTILNNITNIEPITLIEGYTEDVTFSLYGELSSYFDVRRQGAVILVTLQTSIPSALIPANRIIVLEIRASAPQAGTAHATLVFQVVVEDDDPSVIQLVFDAPYYTGSYNASAGLIVDSPISLSQGYDVSVQFALEGENAQWFGLRREQNSVSLIQTSTIPSAVLIINRQLVFFVTAQRPGTATVRAPIIISLTDALQTGDDVSFDKVLYNGIIQGDDIQHEAIILSNFDGTNVDIVGEYGSLFVASVANGAVTVRASGSVTLPTDVVHLPLELRAANAGAVLLLKVVQSGTPVVPSVSFTSESYVLNVEIVHTGFLGRVSATADNGEAITYSISTNNTHLQGRLSINNGGELHLSAPANSGIYTFQVIATTVITQARATAVVYLTVEAITVCGANEIVVPPLITLTRDEEEPHHNLVTLNSTQHAGCHFSLTNRWPSDQTWLYVDEYGLHTTAIDREDKSIAFMVLSQVQVELVLHCESDNVIRTKRSTTNYDYGDNRWILTDTILYNSRRSFVNLIVNDINDNAPIFVGKEHEPIAVGYPVEELVGRILPRSLVELKATDADIGENAALMYWTSESELAVAPTTGFVHVRSNARLQDNQTLIVSATDRNGEGLTGSIQLMVKLLRLNNIAVVTLKGAFLDDEVTVLTQLSQAVGYEVKTLRSVVTSDNTNEDVTRKKRETTPGTVLQLYIYGLIGRDPVIADRLLADINNNATMVNVVSSLTLEDHLKDSEITIIERDIALLVATIVLSILLFLLILVIAIWYYLRWRKNKNYNKFSDQNSLASRNESLGEQSKPDGSVPRLKIEDLKKSERRLQEMLNTPIEEVTVKPVSPKKETPVEAILDLPLPLPETNAPIVIQSIDKLKDAEESDDEFGEKKERRKSVVTFNENVEKIIHVEDVDDSDNSSESSTTEVYKL